MLPVFKEVYILIYFHTSKPKRETFITPSIIFLRFKIQTRQLNLLIWAFGYEEQQQVENDDNQFCSIHGALQCIARRCKAALSNCEDNA
jgi:hypothetical protein